MPFIGAACLSLGVNGRSTSSHPASPSRSEEILIAGMAQGTVNKPLFSALFYFDRTLHLVHTASLNKSAQTAWNPRVYSSIARGIENSSWITLAEPPHIGSIIQLDTGGSIVRSMDIKNTPTRIAVDRMGNVYVLAMGASGTLGSISKIGIAGTIVWTSQNASSLFANEQPTSLLITDDMHLYLCGHAYDGAIEKARVAEIDSTTGILLSWRDLPNLGAPGFGVSFTEACLGGNNNIWIQCGVMKSGRVPASVLARCNGQEIDRYAYFTGSCGRLRIDSFGRPLILAGQAPGMSLDHVARLDPESGVFSTIWTSNKTLLDFAIGPAGDELFVIRIATLPKNGAATLELMRVFLCNNSETAVLLDPDIRYAQFLEGDSTGFEWAAFVDPRGDADHDGVANLAELMMGGDPYDARKSPAHSAWATVAFEAISFFNSYWNPGASFAPRLKVARSVRSSNVLRDDFPIHGSSRPR